MDKLLIICGIVLVVLLFIVFISYICFHIVFFASRKPQKNPEEYPIPKGEIYEPYRDIMVGWTKETRKLPCEEFCITSFDGLKLYGKYYEYQKGAPIELMFHGYRGSAERDLCGGVQRCFALGRNVLIVDQRTSCKSEGHIISFGINESRDCLNWIDFVVERFGPDVRLILTGISMGASTVIMAAGNPLPSNVVGVLADCGYSSPRNIIQKCIKDLRLPVWLVYPFIKLGAHLFGHFDLESNSPIEAITKCQVPIILFHGEDDDFVPCNMSRENYDACVAPKRLVTIPKAGHGLSYILDPDYYLQEVASFFTEHGVPTEVVAHN